MTTTLTDFIAVADGFNAWGRGQTPGEALDNLRRHAITSNKAAHLALFRKAEKTIYASDKPIMAQADVMLRMFAQDGALLVKFKP